MSSLWVQFNSREFSIQKCLYLLHVQPSLFLAGLFALAMDALRQVGIDDLAPKKANQLSGGRRQRVAMARSIVNHPGMILADEPMGTLDTETSAHVMALQGYSPF